METHSGYKTKKQRIHHLYIIDTTLFLTRVSHFEERKGLLYQSQSDTCMHYVYMCISARARESDKGTKANMIKKTKKQTKDTLLIIKTMCSMICPVDDDDRSFIVSQFLFTINVAFHNL